VICELKAPLGAGTAAAGCRGCGEVFTTDSNFDRHQRQRDDRLTCMEPRSAGLERKASGRWGLPGSEVPWHA
jgi:hypothetical protein